MYGCINLGVELQQWLASDMRNRSIQLLQNLGDLLSYLLISQDIVGFNLLKALQNYLELSKIQWFFLLVLWECTATDAICPDRWKQISNKIVLASLACSATVHCHPPHLPSSSGTDLGLVSHSLLDQLCSLPHSSDPLFPPPLCLTAS